MADDSRFPMSASMEDDFQLPVHGLFADLATGSGSVTLDDEFLQSPAAVQLSVLASWQQDMEHYRRRALVGLFRETCLQMGKVPLPSKVARFESICKAIGQPCPVEITMMVQQY